jgi:cell division protease FtsH
LLQYAHPLVKVSIVPRGTSLGAAWYLPEERQITTKEQIMDEICAALGGRVAEEIIFGSVSTGALSDLEKITKQAYALVTIYGLNDKIGNVSFYDSSGNQDYNFTKPYSEKTAETIDEEVRNLIDFCYKRTIDLLKEHKDQLDHLAKELLDKEVIFKEDLEKIFGKRPYDDQGNLISEDTLETKEETIAEDITKDTDESNPVNTNGHPVKKSSENIPVAGENDSKNDVTDSSST